MKKAIKLGASALVFFMVTILSSLYQSRHGYTLPLAGVTVVGAIGSVATTAAMLVNLKKKTGGE